MISDTVNELGKLFAQLVLRRFRDLMCSSSAWLGSARLIFSKLELGLRSSQI